MTNLDPPNQTTELPPPPAPRELNPIARRRSWGEPRVRTWWLLAIVVTVAMVAIATDRFLQARIAAYRVAHWFRTDAKVVQINTSRRPSLVAPPGDTPPAILNYADQTGKRRETLGTIHPIDDAIKMQQTLPILVDPEHPDVWTDKVTVEPLMSRLSLAFILSPLWLLLVAGALFMRYGTLRLWRSGRAQQAIVLDSRNTAAAPMCRAVRCVLQTGRQDQVFQVIVPSRRANYKAGDVLWVIVPRTGVSPALAACAYSA